MLLCVPREGIHGVIVQLAVKIRHRRSILLISAKAHGPNRVQALEYHLDLRCGDAVHERAVIYPANTGHYVRDDLLSIKHFSLSQRRTAAAGWKSQNGPDQWLATERLAITLGFIASPLHRLVRHVLFALKSLGEE